MQEGETIIQAAVRELAEESTVVTDPSGLEQVARIEFYRGDQATFECHVFFVHKWKGEFKETEEMAMPQWFGFDEVPFDRMWDSDRKWLEIVLAGKKIRAWAFYDAEDTKMERFEYEELKQGFEALPHMPV